MRNIFKPTAFLSVLIIMSLMLSSCGVLYFTYEADAPSIPNADGLEDIKDPENPDISGSLNAVDFGFTNKFDPATVLSRFHPYDFEGAFVTVATSSDKCTLFPNTGLYVDSNLYSSASVLQDKFNMSLTKFSSELEELVKTLENAEATGNNYADIVALPLSAVPSFEGKDIFVKISSLPFIDESAEYFSENKNYQITGDYFIGGSASYRISDTKVIYFNTELMKSLGVESPYSLTSAKKWTWDKLCEYLSSGKYFAAEEDILPIIKATVKNAGEKSDAKAAALAEKLNASLISENAKEKFLGGEALFYLGDLADASDFSKTDTVFGLLPIPLFEEGDDYSAVRHSDDITVFACAKSSPDHERAAFIISAINAASHGAMESLYLTVTENSFLRDNGSNLSLGYICAAETAVVFPEAEGDTETESDTEAE